VCTVLVNGRPSGGLHPADRPGMVVENDTRADAGVRRNIVEMLFVEGNHFCMFCEKSGNCELQAMAYRFGITAPKYPYLPGARRGRVAPGHPDRPQPLHPVRPVRAGVARRGRQARVPVRRPRAHKRVAVNADARLADTNLAADRPGRRGLPGGRDLKKRVGYAVPVGERSTTTADRLRHRTARRSEEQDIINKW
jgi:[NiFe] hydrogenase diaphorase moiety small subunit